MTVLMHPAWTSPRAPVRWRVPLPGWGRLRASVLIEVVDRPARRRPRPDPDPRFEAAEALRRTALAARLGSGL